MNRTVVVKNINTKIGISLNLKQTRNVEGLQLLKGCSQDREHIRYTESVNGIGVRVGLKKASTN